MTQPDGEVPDSAIASLSAFAAKTQEEWDDDIRGKTTVPYTKFAGGWGGLLSGILGAGNNALNAITQIGTLVWKVGGSIIDDVGDFINSALSNAATAIANAGTALGNVQATINGIVRGFTGLFGDWAFGDVESATEAVARQAAETAVSVAILQQLNSSNAQSGNSGFVDFASLPNGASLGAAFTQTYSGAGTDTLGVAGGRTEVVPGPITAARVCRFVYNLKVTLSDYQRVSMVFATTPGWKASQSVNRYARNLIRARVAESGTYAGIDCVLVDFNANSFDIGFVASGVWTKWATVSHAFRPGAIYSLDAGSLGGLRQYRVLLNGNTIHTHNEIGTSSHLGSGYRVTGGSAEWNVFTDGNPSPPAAIAAFYMSDNAPPEMLSSVGRVFRASTTPDSFTINTAYVLTTFFDTFDYATADLEWDPAAGSWTVKRRGNYLVHVHLACETRSMNGVPYLRLNGSWRNLGNSGYCNTVSGTLPLEVGDVLTAGFVGHSSPTRLVGAATGDISSFQVTRVSPDNLEGISA